MTNQPSRGVFQEMKQLRNLCADAPEVQLCTQGCATFKGSSVPAYCIPEHRWKHCCQGLSSPPLFWWTPWQAAQQLQHSSSDTQLQCFPPSLHGGISQPEVSLLNHPLIQYQKILLVWQGVKRKWASRPDNTGTSSRSRSAWLSANSLVPRVTPFPWAGKSDLQIP